MMSHTMGKAASVGALSVTLMSAPQVSNASSCKTSCCWNTVWCEALTECSGTLCKCDCDCFFGCLCWCNC